MIQFRCENDDSATREIRLIHVKKRIDKIRARIVEHRPRFVLFYGAGHDPVYGVPYLERWSEIAGESLSPNVVVRREGTTYVATPHATAHGLTNAFWTDLGRRLADFEK